MATVTGISDHYATAELVTVCADAGAPRILDRRSVRLIAPDLPTSPYHHEGLALPLAEAEPVVARTRASVRQWCRTALTDLVADLAVDAVVLRTSPYDSLPESLSDVLASYALTCAADGMMYRETLATQAAAIGLEVHRYPRGEDTIRAAAAALGRPETQVETLLKTFGKSVGRPWRKEHRHAAAAAIAVLAHRAG